MTHTATADRSSPGHHDPRPETRVLKLGFNTRVSFPTGQAAAGLREGIELFKAAEAIGYQSGWAYQRHFDNYLSSPMPFFAAAGQHTSRITLGSAVIPARYQEPILLAEAVGPRGNGASPASWPGSPARPSTRSSRRR